MENKKPKPVRFGKIKQDAQFLVRPVGEILLRDAGKSLTEVVEDVVNVLRANGKADGVGVDPLCCKFRFCELGVGGGGRMDDQRFYIGNIGEKGEDLQAVNKCLCFLRTALDIKGKNRSAALWKIFLIQSMVGMGWQSRMVHRFHARVCGKKFDNL